MLYAVVKTDCHSFDNNDSVVAVRTTPKAAIARACELAIASNKDAVENGCIHWTVQSVKFDKSRIGSVEFILQDEFGSERESYWVREFPDHD